MSCCALIVCAGVELYLWQQNLFMNVASDGTRVWVRVREVDVGLDPLPHCGRIDIHITTASLQAEARWLRLIAVQVDRVRREGGTIKHEERL